MRSFALLVSLILLLSPRTHVVATEMPCETAISFTNGLIWVHVAVPDRAEPLQFVLDTGAGVTVLHTQTARELGLSMRRCGFVQGISGRAAAFSVRGFRGAVGQTALPRKVVALDLASFNHTGGRRLDGLVGLDFFKDRVIQLDYAARCLRVGRVSAPARESIRLTVQRPNDAWCLPVSVNGSSMALVRLDTGYDGGLSWWSGRMLPERTSANATVGLASDHFQGTEAELALGDYSIGACEVAFLPRQLFAREAGLLGNKILSRYRVTFEFSRDLISLEPNE